MSANWIIIGWGNAKPLHEQEQSETATYARGLASENAYRKTSSISRTKYQNLNVSCILALLSSLNPSKPGVKLRMKM